MMEKNRIWASRIVFPRTLDDLYKKLSNKSYIPLFDYQSSILDYSWYAPIDVHKYDSVIFVGGHDLKDNIVRLQKELNQYKDEWNENQYHLLDQALKEACEDAEDYSGKVICVGYIGDVKFSNRDYMIQYVCTAYTGETRPYEEKFPINEEGFTLLSAAQAYYLLNCLSDDPYSFCSARFEDIDQEIEYEIEKFEDKNIPELNTNHVQAFVMNNSFEKSLDELLLDMQYRGCLLLEELMSCQYNEWSVPRWCKDGDICFFMFSKTSLATIRRLENLYYRNKEKYSARERRLIEKGISRGEELYSKYGGCVFGVGKVSGSIYFSRDTDNDHTHWNSPIYAPIDGINIFLNPIHIDDFRDFLTISRASSITPVLGDSFNELKSLIVTRNEVPIYLKNAIATPIPIKDITEENWISFGMEYRRHFFLEDAFRRYYVDYLLKLLGDTKKYYRECGCYKSEGNPPRVDNIIRFNGKLLPVEIKLSISNERNLPKQVEQYCHIEKLDLNGMQVINTGDILYDDNVLIVDTEKIYMYAHTTGEIKEIYNLNDLKEISGIDEIKSAISTYLAS